MPVFDEKKITEQLQQGDKRAFSFIFSRYYRDLVLFAHTFLKDTETSEEIVQDVFVTLWEHRHFIMITASLKSYLLKATQNKCLDWLKHQKVKERYSHEALLNISLLENNTEHYVLYSELQSNLDKALQNLPADIAETFRLNRFQGLKYQEIATHLGISVRTVEFRIGKALQLLKEALKDHLWIFVWLFLKIF